MIDREKVIDDLQDAVNDDWMWQHADYYALTMERAIALLKEQEPVKPERAYSGGGSTWWNVCGVCKTAINPNDKYCHECGRAVKWE